MNNLVSPDLARPGTGSGGRLARPDRTPSPAAGEQRARARAEALAGQLAEAEQSLRDCLEAYPDYAEARGDLVRLLLLHNRLAEAAEQVELLVECEPDEVRHLFLKGSIHARLGRHETAIACYATGLAAHPIQPRAWAAYGHVLKTVGRLTDAVAAYRRALELSPHLGEAWWSLANLKTVRFTAEDVASMERSLGAFGLTDDDHVHIDYALGKAHEDEGDFAASFTHYARAAALRRQSYSHAASDLNEHVTRCKALFTPEFFAERAGQGCDASDPIFVVGLPRAGSTLVEQILCSHSQVEPTQELQDIIALARRVAEAGSPDGDAAYPAALADLSPSALRELGEEYLRCAAIYRLEGRPLFIDKMPNNFAHMGLIHLILPNARIIDVRRHPLSCGFAVFKQHFAFGHTFSYDLDDIGRYYADYVELMAHFDATLPGRVHRVHYERLVAEPEAEVRRLLEHCGLPFEESCLRHYENGRSVRTPSAEQVRQPIYSHATAHWRNFEPWLDPLKAALGPVLEAYPDAPDFAR